MGGESCRDFPMGARKEGIKIAVFLKFIKSHAPLTIIELSAAVKNRCSYLEVRH